MTDRKLLYGALALEVSAIALNSYAVPGAKALWIAVALVVYWLIARGLRAALLFQLAVATVGTVVFAIGLRWLGAVYALEAMILVVVWRLRFLTAEPPPDANDLRSPTAR